MSHQEREIPQGGGFKVEDRRLFTPDGTLREDAAAAPKAVKTSVPEPAPGEARPATDPAFMEIIEFLAGNAFLSLGMGPDGGLGGPTDLRAARAFAQMMEVLKERTRGRMSEEEERLLEARLYDVQMVFVQKSGAARR